MRCDECGEIADEQAAGWVGVVLDLSDDPDSPEVGIFCPDCVQREFDGRIPRDGGRATHRGSG